MPTRLAGPTAAWAWEQVDLASIPSSDFTLCDLGRVTSLSLRVLVCKAQGCRVSRMHGPWPTAGALGASVRGSPGLCVMPAPPGHSVGVTGGTWDPGPHSQAAPVPHG